MSAEFSFLSVESSDDGLRAEILVAADGRWFEGHFPGAPVLPAIAHFDLLCRAHRAGGGSGRIASLDRVRLASPVRPGDRLTLTLEPAAEDSWRFRVRAADGGSVSEGQVRWAQEAAAR